MNASTPFHDALRCVHCLRSWDSLQKVVQMVCLLDSHTLYQLLAVMSNPSFSACHPHFARKWNPLTKILQAATGVRTPESATTASP